MKRQCAICKTPIESLNMTTADKEVIEKGVPMPDVKKKDQKKCVWEDVSLKNHQNFIQDKIFDPFFVEMSPKQRKNSLEFV